MNTFSQPYVVGVQAAFTCPLVDSRIISENRERFRRDKIPMLERANSIYIPNGRFQSRGWILLRRSDYQRINKYSDALQLSVGDPTNKNNIGTLYNLSIVQAQCVTRGLSSDANAVYLVELTDDRGVLYNKWFQAPLTKAYNIRSPAYPQQFHSPSTNSGTPWTWAGMLQDMWSQINTFDGGNILGAWPGLPSTPTGTPEGWWFLGVPAWYAINDVIEYLGMSVACDLTKTNPFTIVNLGDTDTTFTGLQSKFVGNLEDDLEWIDTGAGRVPLNVNVLFKRRNQNYGTEETIRNDSLQWQMTPYYPVVVPAPSTFSKAVGSHFIWCDFTVEYDIDNNPIAGDVTTANAIAAERTTQYFQKIYRQTSGFMTQVYAGALPFTTGSLVDGVRYYQDYSSQKRQGWKTEIVRGLYPPWADVWETVT
jgi:hypothetical protein